MARFALAVRLLRLAVLSGFALTTQTQAKAQDCPVPFTPESVIICTPQDNFTVDGPVELRASANVVGLTLMRLYDNNQPVYESPISSMDTFLHVATGLHQLVVVAYDSAGNAFQQATHIIVTDGSAGHPCGIPQTDQPFHLCDPTSGRAVDSPLITFRLDAVEWPGNQSYPQVHG